MKNTCFLVFCPAQKKQISFGTISIRDGVWGNNGRSLESVATVTCNDGYYPSGVGEIPGYIPDSNTMKTSCKPREDGWGHWDNGILDCFQGNENIIAFGLA